MKKCNSMLIIVLVISISGLISSCGKSIKNKISENVQEQHFQFGEQLEKKPICMIKIDGELYYESGLISDLKTRCGTFDGKLKYTKKYGEIPQNDGEANFTVYSDYFGYQNATDITKEVLIDGNWIIFKKFDNYITIQGNNKNKDDLKYCFYIRGHLNNAAVDSEIVVLTDNKEITFSDIYEPMLSSQLNVSKKTGQVIYTTFKSNDEWGITLRTDDVSDEGMTLEMEQFGGNFDGNLEMGEWFSIEKNIDGEWILVDTAPLDYGWNDIAYNILKNDITEFEIDWEWLYGELNDGYYRLNKEIINFRKTGDYDKKIYSAYFSID